MTAERLIRNVVITLTLGAAAISFCIAAAIVIIGLGSGQYYGALGDYSALGAGLMIAFVGGVPPLLTAIVLCANARLLKRGSAGRAAKAVSMAATLMMAGFAVLAMINRVGELFAFLFFVAATLLAAPLALPSPSPQSPNS